MMERTFAMIKPDAFDCTGAILHYIQQHGYRIAMLRMARMTPVQAALFYDEHRERMFFEALVKFTCSGPVVQMVLKKENAVADFRELLGATDSTKAAPGTIRRLWGDQSGVYVYRNACHGSDSAASAEREIELIFSSDENAMRLLR